jgi:hypothetical protein
MIFNGGAGMDLADLRRVYARQVLTLANALNNASLEAAYAAVPRERFLGRGEWRINTPWSIGALIPNDPVLIYQDVVVALDRERHPASVKKPPYPFQADVPFKQTSLSVVGPSTFKGRRHILTSLI